MVLLQWNADYDVLASEYVNACSLIASGVILKGGCHGLRVQI